jgi:hypothetical protein
LAKIVVAAESDLGADRIYRLKLPLGGTPTPSTALCGEDWC